MRRRIASFSLLVAAALLPGCTQDAAPPPAPAPATSTAPAPTASPTISETNPSIKSLPVDEKMTPTPPDKP